MIAFVDFKAILDRIDHASQRVKMIGATMMSGSFTPKKVKDRCFAFAGQSQRPTTSILAHGYVFYLVLLSPNATALQKKLTVGVEHE